MHFTPTPGAQQENIRAGTPACPSDAGQWLAVFDHAGKLRASQWIHALARRHHSVDTEQLPSLLRVDIYRRLYDHPPQCDDARKLLEILSSPSQDFMDYLGLVLEFVQLPRREQDQWGGALAWSHRGQPDATPTDKQVRYLRYLGHRGPLPQTRAEASRLINKLRQS